MEPISLIIGLLAGLGGGVAATLLVQRKRLAQRIEASRCEFEAYREDVTRHYLKTADLVDRLTQDYKALFEHLNEGAMKQMKPEVLEQKLASRRAPPVVLGVLGRQGLPAPSTAAQGPGAGPARPAAPSEAGRRAKPTPEPKAAANPQATPPDRAPQGAAEGPAQGHGPGSSEPGPSPALPPAPIPLGDLPPRP